MPDRSVLPCGHRPTPGHRWAPRHRCGANDSRWAGVLVALINDVLGFRVTQPQLAGDVLIAHTTVDDSPGARPGLPRPRGSRALPGGGVTKADGGSGGTGQDDASSPVAGEHAEIWRIVEKAQQGDADAFGLLYDRYVDPVFRFVYYRVNDRQLAEDFTSETFVRALRRIGTISYQGRDIGAWFITIARNIVLDHHKSARARMEVVTGDTVEPREHAASTETTVLGRLTAERLRAAVAELGAEQRECIQLRFMQGLSVSETAAVMGKNDGAIKALQHRAVRKLADLVGAELA